MEDYEPEMIEEMRDLQEEDLTDQTEDDMLNRQTWQEAYGVPEPEEKVNQHTFLKDSLSFESPEKVTFLNQYELGRPLFNLRFLLDIEDICKYYLDELAKEYNLNNRIANYFREKINNVCASGMSNEGFVQGLNVSKRIDVKKQRIKNLQPIKGGKAQWKS